MNDTCYENRLERATAARLAQLANRRVDVSQLERCFEQVVRKDAAVEVPEITTVGLPRPRWQQWATPAAAAILTLMALSWLVLDGGASPAMAAPVGLAQFHFDMTNGHVPYLEVSSVEEANRLLTSQSNGIMSVPELPGTIRFCCLYQHVGTTLACALIERDGHLITIAVADASKIHAPKGEIINHNKQQFFFHSVNGINMVMMNESGRWLCVMGEVERDVLVKIAAEIRF